MSKHVKWKFKNFESVWLHDLFILALDHMSLLKANLWDL